MCGLPKTLTFHQGNDLNGSQVPAWDYQTPPCGVISSGGLLVSPCRGSEPPLDLSILSWPFFYSELANRSPFIGISFLLLSKYLF